MVGASVIGVGLAAALSGSVVLRSDVSVVVGSLAALDEFDLSLLVWSNETDVAAMVLSAGTVEIGMTASDYGVFD